MAETWLAAPLLGPRFADARQSSSTTSGMRRLDITWTVPLAEIPGKVWVGTPLSVTGAQTSGDAEVVVPALNEVTMSSTSPSWSIDHLRSGRRSSPPRA